MTFVGMRPGEVRGGWEHPPGPVMMRGAALGAAALGSALLEMLFLARVLCMWSVGDCWDPPPEQHRDAHSCLGRRTGRG